MKGKKHGKGTTKKQTHSKASRSGRGKPVAKTGKSTSKGATKRGSIKQDKKNPIHKPNRKENKVTKRVYRNEKKQRQKPSIEFTKKRGQDQVNISFKGVRKIEKKLDLLDSTSARQVKDLLNKNKILRPGKTSVIVPPRGVVLVMNHKGGKSIGKVSPVELAISNEKVLKKWIREQIKKFSQEFEDKYEGDSSPDNITNIEVKFFY